MRIAGRIATSAAAATFCLAGLCLIAVTPAPVQAQAQQPDLTVLKQQYRRPPPLAIENPALVDLGRELFFDRASPRRARRPARAATLRRSAGW